MDDTYNISRAAGAVPSHARADVHPDVFRNWHHATGCDWGSLVRQVKHLECRFQARVK